MNRASLAVTSLALGVLLVLFPPGLLRGDPAGRPSPVPAPASPGAGPDCPRPSFGAADTDAVLLCIADSLQDP